MRIVIPHHPQGAMHIHDDLCAHEKVISNTGTDNVTFGYRCAACKTHELVIVSFENFDGSYRTADEMCGRIIYAAQSENLQGWRYETNTKEVFCPACSAARSAPTLYEYWIIGSTNSSVHFKALRAYKNVAVPAKSTSGQLPSPATPRPVPRTPASPAGVQPGIAKQLNKVWDSKIVGSFNQPQFNIMSKMLKEVLPFVHDGGTLTNEQKVYVELKLGDIRELKKHLETGDDS